MILKRQNNNNNNNININTFIDKFIETLYEGQIKISYRMHPKWLLIFMLIVLIIFISNYALLFLYKIHCLIIIAIISFLVLMILLFYIAKKENKYVHKFEQLKRCIKLKITLKELNIQNEHAINILCERLQNEINENNYSITMMLSFFVSTFLSFSTTLFPIIFDDGETLKKVLVNLVNNSNIKIIPLIDYANLEYIILAIIYYSIIAIILILIIFCVTLATYIIIVDLITGKRTNKLKHSMKLILDLRLYYATKNKDLFKSIQNTDLQLLYNKIKILDSLIDK